MLMAFDLAERALREHPDDVWLRHRAVLALARAGSTSEATRRFADYGLKGVDDEDVAALEARIAKDDALAQTDPLLRSRAAETSARLYEEIFQRTGGYYPAVNAATLYLLAGKRELAENIAAEALEAVTASGDDSYYAHATVGEAELVRGNAEAARAALEQAAAHTDRDFAAIATTRRQLRLVCEARELDSSVFDALRTPGVAHFCGHRIAAPGNAGRFPAEAETQVRDAIRAEVERRAPGFAYGALASGADILWAEALLDAGAELHVVLPFSADEFIRTSVEDSGADWVERYERCLAAATTVTFATADAYLGDDVLYRYGSELAMGLALLRAQFLDTDVWQWAVWNGLPPIGPAGTAVDVEAWRATGHESVIVELESDAAAPADEPKVVETTDAEDGGRVVRSLLFADVTGFSRMPDEAAPLFADHVLGALAGVLARHGDAVEQRNTWGDALYVVMRDAPSAAACATDLQWAMQQLDLKRLKLPPHLTLRLGAHHAPVFPVTDPVLHEPAFMGSHVSRTARIEPVTPPGEIYATEAFAAALMLSGGDYTADYVGHMPAAKDFGVLRMYRVRRRRAHR